MSTHPSQSATAYSERQQAYVVDADYVQQRMWFLEQLWANEGAYNVAVAIRLTGEVDADQLQSAIDRTVSRHETLRTGFEDEDDTLKQIIYLDRPVKLIVRDVSESHIGEHIARNAKRHFDLKDDPLLYVELLRISPNDSVLILVLHHIIADERSVSNLYAELSAQMSDPRAVLPDLPVQYADYSQWQQRRLDQATLGAQLEYWKQRFATLPDPLDLPIDHPRPAVQSTAGDRHEFFISAAASQRLIRLCRSQGTTLFSGVVAAYTALLARLTNQTDLVVGTPTANRNRPELEPLIGMFLNTVMLRSSLTGATNFQELLASAQRESIAAIANQDVPFERLVQQLRPPRDASRSPIFQTMVTFQGEPFIPQKFGECSAEWYPTDRGVARFELSLYAEVADGKLLCELEYNKDLFCHDTVVRFAEYFEALIQQATLRPSEPLLSLNILPHSERQSLIYHRNTTTQLWPKETLIESIDAHAQSQPTRVAAQCSKHSYTYADIRQRSTAIAHLLMQRGVKPGDRVAVCVDRSADVVCWLLAIWRVGAAYVPIDPHFPVDRCEHIIRDSQCRLVVADDTANQRLNFGNAMVHIDSTNHGDALGKLPEAMDDNTTAYVIYTSGSTGLPKGVSISHGALKNFLHSMGQSPGLDADDCLLSVTTLSFDISVLELFAPLLAGGRIVVASHAQTLDGRELASLLNSRNITVMQATPATWQLMLESGWAGGARPIKLLCGGEAMPIELGKALLDTGGGLWNMYGPTETTVWSSIQRVTQANLEEGPSIPIGVPIANTQLFVLNENLSPVPRGVCGQLFIGGSGLASEYLNQPELTAQKFVDSPLVGGKRLYATGDLVRVDTANNLLFMGRTDFQVKVRGFRIELGEVENAIEKATGTQQVVVTARKTSTDSQENQLVAYIIQPEQQRSSASELRDQLRGELPEYMLPSHFVWLDSFPLTPNRKVDRKRLPEPITASNAGDNEDIKRASDRLEEKLVLLWQSVLGVPEVGVDQNFFDLGGHSLAAARMMRSVEESVGQRLPLALLLTNPNIESLADSIRRKSWQSEWKSLVTISEGGTKAPLFCIHAAGGNILLYRDLAKHLGKDRPIYGLQSEALDGNLPEADSVEDIAARYVEEIRNVQPSGVYNICGYCLGGTIAYEVAQRLHRSGATVGTVALFDTHRKWLDYSLPTQLYANWQQIYFHAGNLVLSGPGGLRAFVGEKLTEWKRRRLRRSQAIASQLKHSAGDSSKTLHVLDGFYDEVSAAYQPQPYSGRLSVFRPRAAYVGYDSQTLGWQDLVSDLNVVSLPVYPAGMLLEPFVTQLAAALEVELGKAKHPGSPHEKT